MANYDLDVLQETLGDRLHFFEELDSTNEKALQLGREGAAAGSVVLAERQLAGRGRRGAAWFCGEGKGLAFTVLLRPSFERALWPRLSLVAGLAVARSIESAGLAPEIKWPNDVLIGGRKVCGILVEAEGDFVVVGIGLNVGESPLPAELKEVATSLAREGADGDSRERFLLAILEELSFLQNRLESEFAELLEMVRTRCALSGKRIEFLEGSERRAGLCEGIGDGGDLLVREGGQVKRFVAADQIRVVE